MTISEKILARACGRDAVAPSDVIAPDPELVILHDGYVESAYRQLTQLGYQRVMMPEKVMFVTDHDVVYTSPRVAERAQNNRRIAAQWQVGRFFDAGRGGHGHIFPMEEGLVRPGMFLFAYDPHCTNFGAVGALAVGALTEIVVVLATGTLLIEVPRSVLIELRGELPFGVHARDLGFKLSHAFTSGTASLPFDNRIMEFSGEAVRSMTLASRVGLCNTLTEIGAANTMFPPLRAAGAAELESDSNASYEGRLSVDLSDLTPQLALPGSPDNAAGVEAAAGRPIDHAYLGSCGSSMYEDFALAAEVLAGRRVAGNVRLVVVPGSARIAQRLARDGLLEKFTDAGAIVLPPSCGPCAGGRSGLLGPGEVSISTAATNTQGRMGAPTSEAYLASPLTVAASAVAGRITDPREVLASRRPS